MLLHWNPLQVPIILNILVPAELTDELKYDLSPISMVSAAANPGTPIAVIDFSPEEIVLGENLIIL